MTYLIHEDNIERLEKQLKTIQNKCNKLGTEFGYRKGNEVWKVIREEGTCYTHTARFIEVEAWGTAKINGWTFVAVIEHMDGKGKNIVRQFDMNYTVPDRYYTAPPTCEHCKTNRLRKQTYLPVSDQGEWKQVGGSCLREFTGGFDAEQLASYISCFDKLIEGENVCWASSRQTKYYNTKFILSCTAELVRAFGYAGTDSTDSTYVKAIQLYNFLSGYPVSDKTREHLEEMINKYHISPDSDETVSKVNNLIEWVLNTADCSYGYMSNLRAVVDTEYVKVTHLGLLCSAIPTYNREMARIAREEARKAKMEAEALSSSYAGNKGEKITVKVAECKCISSWENQYGTTHMYKFVDVEGRVLIWVTSNYIDCEHVVELTGKVKNHQEYQGVKQTIVYFCKVKEKQPTDPRPSAEDLAANAKAMAEIDAALDMLINGEEDADRDIYSPSQPWNAPGMKVSDFIR